MKVGLYEIWSVAVCCSKQLEDTLSVYQRFLYALYFSFTKKYICNKYTGNRLKCWIYIYSYQNRSCIIKMRGKSLKISYLHARFTARFI